MLFRHKQIVGLRSRSILRLPALSCPLTYSLHSTVVTSYNNIQAILNEINRSWKAVIAKTLLSHSCRNHQKRMTVTITRHFSSTTQKISTGYRSRSSSTNLSSSPLRAILQNARKYPEDVATVDENGFLTYADILHHGMLLHLDILKYIRSDGGYLNGERIALLTEKNACYVIGQFATWFSGGVSVPLCEDHPISMWEYFLENSECSLILASKKFLHKISPTSEKLSIPIIVLERDEYNAGCSENSKQQSQSESVFNPRNEEDTELQKAKLCERSEKIKHDVPALILYTSGTTGRPKGVVQTHGNLMATISGMTESWAWSAKDVILHVLPLHHAHGIFNCLLTPLTCGATCVMENKFDAERVWNLLTATTIPSLGKSINLFMAVPTIYSKLVEYFDECIVTGKEKSHLTASSIRAATINNIRLMVSGSAALPSPVSDRWFEITGHRLLERYGMTEVGMALTNPLKGERIPGAVGNPFPKVEVRIVRPSEDASLEYDDILAEGNHNSTTVSVGAEGESGELLIKGPTVFKEYWNNSQATAESFTQDGWFKTGDTAVFENGVYRIVGRTSVDVIKSGGYKISALEVERHLLAHPDIKDCAVVGLPDATWGQRVAAVLSMKDNESIDVTSLRQWAGNHMAPYQIPTVVKCLPAIPRNIMGKVNKKELVTQVFPQTEN